MKKDNLTLENGTPIGNGRFLLADNTLIRIYQTSKNPFVNNKIEQANIKATKKLDYVEKVYNYNVETGRKESYLIKDSTKFQNGNKDHIRIVAKTLKAFHTSGIKLKNKFNAIKRLKEYHKYTDNAPWSKEERDLLKEVKELYTKYPLVCSHNNVSDKNILFKNKKGYLYNLEEAAMNIYLFDLAFFIDHHTLEQEDIDYLYKCYGKVNKKDAETMVAFLSIFSKYQDKYISTIVDR